MQTNTYTLCNTEVGIGKHDIHFHVQGLKKEYRFTNNVEYELRFALTASNIV